MEKQEWVGVLLANNKIIVKSISLSVGDENNPKVIEITRPFKANNKVSAMRVARREFGIFLT